MRPFDDPEAARPKARCPWCEANELHDRLAKLEAALGYAVTQLEAANELLFEERVRGEEDGVGDIRQWIHETRAGLLKQKGGA